MAIEGEILFRDRVAILNQMMEEMQTRVSDVYLGSDGNLRIVLEVVAGAEESIFLANQILSEDMFIATAHPVAVEKWGEEFGILREPGTYAEGEVIFTGDGGEYIPFGTQVAYSPGPGLDLLYYNVTEDGTIPNPGIPTAPSVAEGAAGVLDGLYIYGVTFITTDFGYETEIGEVSESIDVDTKKIELTNIPLGGVGTTKRNIYRSFNGGEFQFLATLNDNTTMVYTDNIAVAIGPPPVDSTAERIVLGIVAEKPGAAYNAAAHTITQIVSSSSAITFVDNPLPLTGGAEPETDEEYRQSLAERVKNPQSGSANDLKSWAEEHPEVANATVYPNMNDTTPTPGHVTVRISDSTGSPSAPEVIDDVQDILDEKDIANIIIHVLTYNTQAEEIEIEVTMAAAEGEGPDWTLDDLENQIEAAILNYVNSLQVGETLRVNGIIDAVFGLVGVEDLTVITPATDQPAADAITKIIADPITISEAP